MGVHDDGLQSDLLLNDTATKKDLRLVKRYLRWDGIDENARAILNRLMRIVDKETCEVMTKQGPVFLDSAADQNAIAASGVIVQMMAQNQREELAMLKAMTPQQQQPQSPLIALQINNGGTLATSDAGGETPTQIAERIRVRRLSQQSPG